MASGLEAQLGLGAIVKVANGECGHWRPLDCNAFIAFNASGVQVGVSAAASAWAKLEA
jgi:hypothetical protein